MRRIILFIAVFAFSINCLSQELDFFSPERIMPGYEARYLKTVNEDGRDLFSGIISIQKLETSEDDNKDQRFIIGYMDKGSAKKIDEFLITYDKAAKHIVKVQQIIDGIAVDIEKEDGIKEPYLLMQKDSLDKISPKREKLSEEIKILDILVPAELDKYSYTLKNEVKDPNNPYLVLSVTSRIEERKYTGRQKDLPPLLRYEKETVVSKRFVNKRDPERKYPMNRDIPMITVIELIEYKRR